MYLYHYGLTELPFSLTPDTDFYCELPVYSDAMNVLRVALESGEGFVKVVGEVGTGKTMLCRMLLNYLDKRAQCAYLPNPYLSPNELRLALASELSIRVARTIDQYQLTEKINAKILKLHQKGKPVVVIVDEAQAIPRETLEALRLFTNLETEKQKLLQVVLFAQPELDQRLAKPELRQLRQRIAFSCQLKALDMQSINIYVNHRLRAAGLSFERVSGGELFSASAMKKLLKYSRGIPRLVNILAHKSMMLAYGNGRFKVEAIDVKKAAKDTDDVSFNYWWLGLAAAVLISGSIYSIVMAGWLP
jgi:MSHA biogenesis protein MshM